jgi:hypothetical protein
MIHNHEVPGSIPGLATETEKAQKALSVFCISIKHGFRGLHAKL